MQQSLLKFNAGDKIRDRWAKLDYLIVLNGYVLDNAWTMQWWLVVVLSLPKAVQ